jgi:hypothetical protein
MNEESTLLGLSDMETELVGSSVGIEFLGSLIAERAEETRFCNVT